MNAHRCSVGVVKSEGIGSMIVWAQVPAQNTITAKSLLEALHGRGNVIGVPALVR